MTHSLSLRHSISVSRSRTASFLPALFDTGLESFSGRHSEDHLRLQKKPLAAHRQDRVTLPHRIHSRQVSSSLTHLQAPLSSILSCVQKLRRQIAMEDQSTPSPASVEVVGEDLQTSAPRTRASSLSRYTARSIVNLSGLSVSDPLPGSYETSVMDRRNRSSSITSSLAEEDVDKVPTSTYRYNPRQVSLPSLLSPILSLSLTLVSFTLWLSPA
jgi:hypothetical protein